MKKINYFAPLLLVILFSLLAVFIYSNNKKPQTDNNTNNNELNTNITPMQAETIDTEYVGVYKADTTDANGQEQTVTIEIKNDKSVELTQSFLNKNLPTIIKVGTWERGSKGTLKVNLTTQNSQTINHSEYLSFVLENNGTDITISLLNASDLGWGESGLFLKKQMETTADTLIGTKWVWVQTLMNNDEKIVPSTPGKYTLAFNNNNQLNITTDCNIIGKSIYKTNENNSLVLTIGVTTRKSCQNSTESEYLNNLTQIESFIVENDKLFLQIKMDSGVMEFESIN